MNISNISFGASFDYVGNKIVNEAKTIARIKSTAKKTNDDLIELANSLSTIEHYRPYDTLEFSCRTNEDKHSRNAFIFEIKLHGRCIYSHPGNEFDFINDFAKNIEQGKII